MKSLIFLALLIPVLSFGQKFEISEQAGYSTMHNNDSYGFNTDGFSNQLSFTYHPIKYFSISALYEFNNWHPDNNSFGIAPDFTTKYFYAGIDLKVVTFATNDYYEYNSPEQINKFTPSFGYGVHIGAKQRISKRLSIIEQFGNEQLPMNWHITYNPSFLAQSQTENELLNIYYLRAGMSYRL